MPQRIIQINEEDTAAWDRFEELAGDSASARLTTFVRDYVAQLDSGDDELQRIELEVVDDQKERHINAFTGRWLVEPASAVRSRYGDQRVVWSIAETAAGRFVAHTRHDGLHLPDTFDVFEDEEELAGAIPDDIMARVRKALGESPVRELDI